MQTPINSLIDSKDYFHFVIEIVHTDMSVFRGEYILITAKLIPSTQHPLERFGHANYKVKHVACK